MPTSQIIVVPMVVTDAGASRWTTGSKGSKGIVMSEGREVVTYTIASPPISPATFEGPPMVECTSTVLAAPSRGAMGLRLAALPLPPLPPSLVSPLSPSLFVT